MISDYKHINIITLPTYLNRILNPNRIKSESESNFLLRAANTPRAVRPPLDLKVNLKFHKQYDFNDTRWTSTRHTQYCTT